jgi:hypothetical protein
MYSKEKQSMAVTCLLEEYKNCRSEIQQSLTLKFNFYAYEYVVFGALVAFFCQLIGNEDTVLKHSFVRQLLLIPPIFFYFLAFTYLQSHFRVYYNAHYI